jgi:hypothetical protein
MKSQFQGKNQKISQEVGNKEEKVEERDEILASGIGLIGRLAVEFQPGVGFSRQLELFWRCSRK